MCACGFATRWQSNWREARRPDNFSARTARGTARSKDQITARNVCLRERDAGGHRASNQQRTVPRINRHHAPHQPVVVTGKRLLPSGRENRFGNRNLPSRPRNGIQPRRRSFHHRTRHVACCFVRRAWAVLILRRSGGMLMLAIGTGSLHRAAACGLLMSSHANTAPAHRQCDAEAEQ